MGRKLRIVIYLLLLGAIALGLVWLLGPRPVADTSITFQSASLPEDLTTYVAERENAFDDIRPGNQKQILWAYPKSKAKTAFAIVFVHGFSASPAEIRPVPDNVAKSLGANLFFTRLAGHGRNGDAMSDASVNAWVNDYAEAIAIGRRIGEKVIVMATSTGASLATWAAERPELSGDVAGYVFLSPNYGVRARGSFLLTGPYAPQLVKLILGERRSFEARRPGQAENWTTDYPSLSVIPMGQIVSLARQAHVENITTPALFIFSPDDRVVRPDLTRDVAERWGADAQMLEITDSEDEYNHVLAGDIMSPATTAGISAKISSWISGL
ncbi:alpha/beta fold hydrolase [Pseudohoeflea suaedae]|uniref:Alpha/beta fold hydrolase n=1 Tax=Pseudohoeflea suaedae TaxID=877384 RepID=A0A4R5PK36_9HYPH|nr:alpha/beta hydrolase [Pseudohoeflea suaedae]TDH36060.1 alpha/beta fold hydrolase [Pseudohoeflea suaedae]